MSDIYLNYLGQVVATSSAATRRYWGNGGTDTLVGSGTDDTFYIYASSETVVEPAGGLATVVVQTWSPYTLPANVTNVTVSGVPGTVVGNSLANLIVAQGTSDITLDGAGGNDVMVANAGTDTFVMGPGYGHAVVYDFDTGKDLIRLAGFNMSSFATVQADMTQKGQDVVIALSGNDSVTLRNTTVGQLTKGNFELSIDTSKLTRTFDDEFNSFTSSPDGSTGWMTSYHDNTRTLSSNHEAEYYSDSSVGVNPFSDNNGILTITAAPAAAGQTPAGSGLTYTSGLITTWKSFSQLYGYFEVRADLPAGQGFWPAFWLLPANGAWPPEIDVLEQIGTSAIYETAHTDDGGFNTAHGFTTQVAGATAGFHNYGVDWEADKITWYIDGTAVASIATPSDMHTPMYMLLNLAVGANGSWPGATDGTSSAKMLIDYVRAYSSTGTAAAPPTVTLTSQVLAADTGVSATDSITSSGAVTLTGTVSGATGTGVQVYDGAVLLGAATVGPGGAWSFATTLGSGTHALSAVATDPAGNTAKTGTATTVTVEATAPVVALTKQVLAVDTGFSATDRITSNGAVTLSGTVAGAAGTNVEIFDGSADLGRATLGTGGTWTFATTLAQGTHALDAVATDLAGNSALSGTAAAITVQTSAPAVAITTGTIVADTGADTLTGTESGSAGTSVAIYQGASLLGAAALDGKGGWSFQTQLATGAGQITAVATDPAGNVTTSAGVLQSQSMLNASGVTIQQTFDSNGLLSLQDLISEPGNGQVLNDYTAGSFFDDKNYWSVTKLANTSGTLLTQELFNRDGSHSFTVQGSDQTVAANYNDTFSMIGSNETIRFGAKWFGADRVEGFESGDVFSFSSSVFANYQGLSRHVSGTTSTVITDAAHDTLTLNGIAPSSLTPAMFRFV